MQATITYMLSEQAQRAQMVATGQPVPRKQVVTVEVPPEDLALFSIDPNGIATLDTAKTYGPTGLGQIADANADIIALVRENIAKRDAAEKAKDALTKANGEQNKRRTEEAYQRFLSDPAARIGWNGLNDYVGETMTPADWFPAAHVEFRAEIERRNRFDEAEKEVADAAKELAKQQWLDRWIADSGDAILQKQWTEGLLARKDLLTMMAKQAFAELGLPPHHTVRLCEDRQCACGIQDVETIPRSEYAAWDKLRETFPEGTMANFEQSRDCLRDSDGEFDEETGDASEPYYTAMVKVPVGPFVFERRILLAGNRAVEQGVMDAIDSE